jgi:hypothetical protein
MTTEPRRISKRLSGTLSWVVMMLVAGVTIARGEEPTREGSPPPGSSLTGSYIGAMHFLFDDTCIDRQSGVRRVSGTPVKTTGSLFVSIANPRLYPLSVNTVIQHRESRLYKMWYTASTPRQAPAPTGDAKPLAAVDPSEQEPEGDYLYFLCYAESRDGLTWNQPPLGLSEFQGSTANNILLKTKLGAGPFYNIVEDPSDPDPSRRYKAIGYQNGAKSTLRAQPEVGGGIVVSFSPDGLRWPSEPMMVMSAQDVTDSDGVLPQRDPRSGKWVGFFRPRTSPKRRFIGLSESDDFLRWSYPRMILTPRSTDSEWTEFYGLSSLVVAGWRVGCLWVFHNDPAASPVTTELIYSSYGQEYRRAAPHEQFLPLGPPGSLDSRAIYPMSIVESGGEILIYFNGMNYEHGSDRGIPMQRTPRVEAGAPPRSGIGLARLPWGHFRGLRADVSGVVETTWLTNYGPGGLVAVVAKDPNGEAQAEILDQYGKEISGWGRAESRDEALANGTTRFYWRKPEFTATAGQVSERGGPIGHVVKVRFHLRGATLYGFQLGQSNGMPEYRDKP